MVSVTQDSTLSEIQDEISVWAGRTFDHNEYGIVRHTIREAVELGRAVGLDADAIRATVEIELAKPVKENIALSEEAADCTILLMALAGYMGFELVDAVGAKHVVNLHRTWGKPDSEGVTEHVD